MEQETDRFTAVADNGTAVTVIETTTFIEAFSTEGRQWVEGLKSYKTARDEFLNVAGPDTFVSPWTGATYRRV